nr:reverse transcriptase domain-containing protein [Tanacetum cinerariifolium]
KRNGNKFCDFHNDKGHSTDECMQLKKKIKELVRAGKLSHLIKEIKQGREQPKTGRKETAAKDKPTTIYMVRSWQRTVKQKITQSFEQGKEITFPPLANSNGTERPLIIEAELKLLVTIGDATHSTKAWMNFMIVKSLSPYNGIIGRPGLKAIQAVSSTVHGMLKFPTEEGIVTIRSFLLIPAECASVGTSPVTPREKKAHPANLTVPLHPNFLDQELVVGGSLSDEGRTELCSLLKRNLDIFAWQPSDMTGVPHGKKHDGSWWMGVDFTDLNKACPQDCYPLPEIDWKLLSPQTIKEVQSLNGKLASLNSPDDRTGDGTDASLLYKPCITGLGTKLLTDEKAGVIIGLCSKKASKIFSGTSYRGEHKITYRPRTSIKRQVLADFLNEMPSNASQGASVAETQQEPWTLFTDGSSCIDGSGAGLILTNPDGVEFTYALRFQFAASNNEAEYEALIAGLRIATQMGVKNIQANVDSKLVANQVLGTYVAKEDNMIKYMDITKGLVSGFKTFSISQVPRSRNKKADALSKIASTSFAHLS